MTCVISWFFLIEAADDDGADDDDKGGDERRFDWVTDVEISERDDHRAAGGVRNNAEL